MSESNAGTLTEARFAVLTPTNRGAIAVVGVWGRDALAIADRVFRAKNGARLAKTPEGLPRLGRVGDGLGDEVVAVVRRPKSDPAFREHRVEFQCHGGFVPCGLVLEALEKEGVSSGEPTLWEHSEDRTPSRLEAWAKLPHAPTVRVAEILLEQAGGVLDREIEGVIQKLSIGTPDLINQSIRSLEALVERAEIGRRLIQGWRVVIAGQPNVGKSSLLNALAGFSRSIVDETPGTTRDVVSMSLAIDGWPVQFSDTAGLRVTQDALELTGIERGQQAYAEADLVLPVLDCSRPLSQQDHDLIRIRTIKDSPIVANKSDLCHVWSPEELGDQAHRLIIVSAKEKLGIDQLVRAIGRSLVPTAPTQSDGIPLGESALGLLTRALGGLSAGQQTEALTLLRSAIGESVLTPTRDESVRIASQSQST